MAEANRSDIQATPSSFRASGPQTWPSTSSVLHLRHDGSPFSRSKTVYGDDEQTPLYAIELHRFEKPHIVIRSASTSETIGEVTFSILSRKITVAMRGASFDFKSRGMFTSGYTYTSPAANNKTFTWNKESLGSSDLICIDDKGIAIARLHVSVFSASKRGKLEIVGGPDRPFVEELLVTAFAYSELRRRRRNSSAGGAGGAAGV